MSVFQRQKKHSGPMADCALCMAKVAAQDAAYADKVTRVALAATQLQNKLAKRRMERIAGTGTGK